MIYSFSDLQTTPSTWFGGIALTYGEFHRKHRGTQEKPEVSSKKRMR